MSANTSTAQGAMYNEGAETSNTINEQFNENFVTEGVVEFDPRKQIFLKRSNNIDMPLNRGDKFSKLIHYPIINKGNMMDNGVNAEVASLVSNIYYITQPDFTVLASFDANDYVTGGTDLSDPEVARTAMNAARALAKDDAIADLSNHPAGSVVKSSAGSILNGQADYMVSAGNLEPLPEKGGIINVMNGSSKLISAKMSFHGIMSIYSVRSVKLDSRKKQLARIIKDLSRALGEYKEMQVQASLIGTAMESAMLCSNTNTTLPEVNVGDFLTYDYLTAFELELQRNDVPMSTEMISGVDIVDTKIIDGAYTLYCTPEMVPTLRAMTDMADGTGEKVFVPFAKYATAEDKKRNDGEVGSIGSFRFLVHKDLMKFKGAGAVIADSKYYSSTKSDGAGGTEVRADVHPLLFVGDDAFSIASYGYANTSAKHIPPAADIHNDAYAETGGVSAKWSYGYLAYRPERITALLCSVTRNGRP